MQNPPLPFIAMSVYMQYYGSNIVTIFKDPNPQNLRILMANHVWSLHCHGFYEPPNKFKVQLHIREGIHKRKDGIQKWLSLQHMNKNKIMTSKEVTWKIEFFFLLYHFLTTHSGQVGGMKCQREDKLMVTQLGELMWCQTVNVVLKVAFQIKRPEEA